jgi:hypothetical protein
MNDTYKYLSNRAKELETELAMIKSWLKQASGGKSEKAAPPEIEKKIKRGKAARRPGAGRRASGESLPGLFVSVIQSTPGMKTAEVVEKLNETHQRNVPKMTASSYLSMLKKKGRIHQDGEGRWSASAAEGDASTHEGDTSHTH